MADNIYHVDVQLDIHAPDSNNSTVLTEWLNSRLSLILSDDHRRESGPSNIKHHHSSKMA